MKSEGIIAWSKLSKVKLLRELVAANERAASLERVNEEWRQKVQDAMKRASGPLAERDFAGVWKQVKEMQAGFMTLRKAILAVTGGTAMDAYLEDYWPAHNRELDREPSKLEILIHALKCVEEPETIREEQRAKYV